LIEDDSGTQIPWSLSAPLLWQPLNKLACTDSHAALDNFECVDNTWTAHCLTICPMSSCFVATSISCFVPNQTMLNQCQSNVSKSGIESRTPSSFRCGTTFQLRKTQMIYSAFCTEPASRVSWFDIMSVIWVWSSPVFQLVLYAAWAALEQCKLLSACGVSFQLLFHQVAFCGQLLCTMLCRSQYLRHDYVAISDRTQCYFQQKLLLCYFILSCRLRIKIVCFILFASSLILPRQNRWHKKRQLFSPCGSTCDRAFSHMND